jgi:hypothetical protein
MSGGDIIQGPGPVGWGLDVKLMIVLCGKFKEVKIGTNLAESSKA